MRVRGQLAGEWHVCSRSTWAYLANLRLNMCLVLFASPCLSKGFREGLLARWVECTGMAVQSRSRV